MKVNYLNNLKISRIVVESSAEADKLHRVLYKKVKNKYSMLSTFFKSNCEVYFIIAISFRKCI